MPSACYGCAPVTLDPTVLFSVLNSTNSAYTEENLGILYAPLFLFAHTVRNILYYTVSTA
jgi:hypothetical protein